LLQMQELGNCFQLRDQRSCQ